MNIHPIIVTGAARPGIGSAITKRLLQDGNTVIGTYEASNAEDAIKLRDLVNNDSLLRLSAIDHSSQAELDSFIASLPNKIGGLVNAEFFFAMEDPDKFDSTIWNKSLAINLTAPNYLIHGAKHLLEDGSSILSVTSTEGFVGSFGASAYAATKAAVHNLTKSLANVLGTRRIRVNSIAAGWIGGVMDTDEVFNLSRRITPLGRLGTAEEIAGVVSFLLSADSSFINGTVIVVDGGYTGVDTIAKYEFDAFRSKSDRPDGN